MARQVMLVEGLAELNETLRQFSKSTSKALVRRVLKKAGTIIADEAARLAPDDPSTTGYDLHTSIIAGTTLSPRQRSLHRKETGTGPVMVSPGVFRSASSDTVEVFAGAGPVPHAHLVEFGTSSQPPRPFMRPAWEAKKLEALNSINGALETEIQKTAARLAKRAARAAKP